MIGKDKDKMKRREYFMAVIIALAIMAFFAISAMAVPLSKEVWEQLKAEGQLDAYIARMSEARARGVDSPEQFKRATTLALSEKTVDTVRVLVLLVDFPGKPGTLGDTAKFDSVLFSEGRKNPTGSLTEYYLENSYGTFYVIGDVYGWFTMPYYYTYYSTPDHGLGVYPNNTQRLTLDAINAADATVDFASYDTYGNGGHPDGIVDGLFIVHAGYGFEESGVPNDIHSHKWSLGTLAEFKDGVTIDPFTVEPELSYFTKIISPIGVFCHEYGHVIGLPDLYDISASNGISVGLGDWSLMATGNYNGGSKTPAHLDAWCKSFLGFVEPINIEYNMIDVSIPRVEDNPIVYKIWADGIYNGPEYFLVENRQKTMFDSLLPAEGLLIYHVDDLNGGNNDGLPYHVAVEQADGLFQLEKTYNNEGDAGDPWPGNTGKRSFDDLSTPNSKGYGPEITQVSVWNISNSGDTMTANFDTRWSRPHFTLDSAIFADADNDGVFEAGENIQLFYYMKNDWKKANNVIFKLSSNDSRLEFLTDSIFKLAINGDQTATNNIDRPFEFKIPGEWIPVFDSFYITIESDGGQSRESYSFEKQVGQPRVLLVDDDRGDADNMPFQNYEDYFTNDLYKMKIPWDYYNKLTNGSPPGALLSQYATVIWFTGDSAEDYLQQADIAAMKMFLNNGGNLFLTGQGIAEDLHNQDSAFLDIYLHAHYGGRASFASYHIGVDGSPIGDGLNPHYLLSNQAFNVTSHIKPANGGFPVFRFNRDSLTEYATAVGFSGPNKVVFFNWGYEAIGDSDVYTREIDTIYSAPVAVPRDTILANIMRFFGDIATDVYDEDRIAILPKNFMLEQNYPNPFNPVTQINYSLRLISGQAIPNTMLKIYNILGQDIKTLVDKRELPGNYTIEWNGTDDTGHRVASGIYFYRLTRGGDVETKKMVLLK
jgi:immune inhibitor A